jgi:aryl-alcohol dehydrogenase-like predicted oxidoreductase
MSTRAINRREFITKCSVKLSAASLFLSQYDAKPAFGEEKKPKVEKKKEPNMEYRTLGSTGLNVSVVSCGMANLRERAVLFRAFDLGINYFDTAHVYRGGNSERMLGEVLKQYGRKKVFMGTKIYPFHERYESSKELRLLERKTLDDMMNESLRRLQTDYVDVFFVHRVPDKRCLSNGDLLAFLENLKKKGKARFVGVSLHDAGIFVDVVNFVLQPNIFDVLLAWLDFQSPPEHIDALKRARRSLP